MTLQRKDLHTVVENYLQDHKPNLRYTAFDYCYNYFHPSIFSPKKYDLEKSCLVLYTYLANWGMLHNSPRMTKVNHIYLTPTVRYIAESDSSLWEIDVDNYTNSNIDRIIATYADVKGLLDLEGSRPVTIVTKILLGVYGFVPAFDNNFCNTFRAIPFENEKNLGEHCGFRSFNPYACQCIKAFYEANKVEIDNFHKKTKTIDFQTGKNTNLRYPKAKIIDMYGFQKMES